MPILSAGPLRSWLFTPGTQPERLLNAAKSNTDISIFDLEDSVSQADKRAARDNLRSLLEGSFVAGGPRLAVRVNSTSSRVGLEDLVALLDAPRMPEYILLPKIESAWQVRQVAALLREAKNKCALVPLIESQRGLAAIDEVLRASPTVVALMFGAADYAADVRAQPNALSLKIARISIASACADVGISAVDAPCFSIHDASQLNTELTFAVENGFKAKASIHPSHIHAINDAFTPSANRISWAKRVIEANKQGVAVIDGQMIDEAIAREAREVLANS